MNYDTIQNLIQSSSQAEAWKYSEKLGSELKTEINQIVTQITEENIVDNSIRLSKINTPVGIAPKILTYDGTESIWDQLKDKYIDTISFNKINSVVIDNVMLKDNNISIGKLDKGAGNICKTLVVDSNNVVQWRKLNGDFLEQIDYSKISGMPSQFSPGQHQHSISDLVTQGGSQDKGILVKDNIFQLTDDISQYIQERSISISKIRPQVSYNSFMCVNQEGTIHQSRNINEYINDNVIQINKLFSDNVESVIVSSVNGIIQQSRVIDSFIDLGSINIDKLKGQFFQTGIIASGSDKTIQQVTNIDQYIDIKSINVNKLRGTSYGVLVSNQNNEIVCTGNIDGFFGDNSISVQKLKAVNNVNTIITSGLDNAVYQSRSIDQCLDIMSISLSKLFSQQNQPCIVINQNNGSIQLSRNINSYIDDSTISLQKIMPVSHGIMISSGSQISSTQDINSNLAVGSIDVNKLKCLQQGVVISNGQTIYPVQDISSYVSDKTIELSKLKGINNRSAVVSDENGNIIFSNDLSSFLNAQTTPISSISGYPNDGSKYISGDGTWKQMQIQYMNMLNKPQYFHYSDTNKQYIVDGDIQQGTININKLITVQQGILQSNAQGAVQILARNDMGYYLRDDLTWQPVNGIQNQSELPIFFCYNGLSKQYISNQDILDNSIGAIKLQTPGDDNVFLNGTGVFSTVNYDTVAQKPLYFHYSNTSKQFIASDDIDSLNIDKIVCNQTLSILVNNGTDDFITQTACPNTGTLYLRDDLTWQQIQGSNASFPAYFCYNGLSKQYIDPSQDIQDFTLPCEKLTEGSFSILKLQSQEQNKKQFWVWNNNQWQVFTCPQLGKFLRDDLTWHDVQGNAGSVNFPMYFCYDGISKQYIVDDDVQNNSIHGLKILDSSISYSKLQQPVNALAPQIIKWDGNTYSGVQAQYQGNFLRDDLTWQPVDGQGTLVIDPGSILLSMLQPRQQGTQQILVWNQLQWDVLACANEGKFLRDDLTWQPIDTVLPQFFCYDGISKQHITDDDFLPDTIFGDKICDGSITIQKLRFGTESQKELLAWNGQAWEQIICPTEEKFLRSDLTWQTIGGGVAFPNYFCYNGLSREFIGPDCISINTIPGSVICIGSLPIEQIVPGTNQQKEILTWSGTSWQNLVCPGSGKFLRDDLTWQTISAQGTVNNIPISSLENGIQGTSSVLVWNNTAWQHLDTQAQIESTAQYPGRFLQDDLSFMSIHSFFEKTNMIYVDFDNGSDQQYPDGSGGYTRPYQSVYYALQQGMQCQGNVQIHLQSKYFEHAQPVDLDFQLSTASSIRVFGYGAIVKQVFDMHDIHNIYFNEIEFQHVQGADYTIKLQRCFNVYFTKCSIENFTCGDIRGMNVVIQDCNIDNFDISINDLNPSLERQLKICGSSSRVTNLNISSQYTNIYIGDITIQSIYHTGEFNTTIMQNVRVLSDTQFSFKSGKLILQSCIFMSSDNILKSVTLDQNQIGQTCIDQWNIYDEYTSNFFGRSKLQETSLKKDIIQGLSEQSLVFSDIESTIECQKLNIKSSDAQPLNLIGGSTTIAQFINNIDSQPVSYINDAGQYVQVSDIRLKQNIVDISQQQRQRSYDMIKNLKIQNYCFKNKPDKQEIGPVIDDVYYQDNKEICEQYGQKYSVNAYNLLIRTVIALQQTIEKLEKYTAQN